MQHPVPVAVTSKLWTVRAATLTIVLAGCADNHPGLGVFGVPSPKDHPKSASLRVGYDQAHRSSTAPAPEKRMPHQIGRRASRVQGFFRWGSRP